MAKRYFRKLAILAKLETTYATDAAPTGAANAMQVSDVNLTPLEGEQVQRDLVLPYFGDQGFVLAATYAQIEFSVEMAGSGTAGTAPAYAPLLRACGMAEIITPGTSVAYQPVSDAPEALSLYANLDGVNHVMVGARGTWTLSVAPRQMPRLRYTMMGLLGPITDVALPSAVLAGFKDPRVPSKANTQFSIHGFAAPMENLSINLGNDVQTRMLVNYEAVEIVDRKVSGTTVIDAQPLATKNWFSTARTNAVGPLSCVHGTAAGGIVEISAPAVQIGKPTYGNSQGTLTNSLPLIFRPSGGDDELVITVR